jgi:S-formylglutathione hydrolase FrmB
MKRNISRSPSFLRRLAWRVLVVAFFPQFGVLLAQIPPARIETRNPRLREAEFQSPSPHRKSKYRVLLPRGYSHSHKRYPVLFLLHGLYGDYTNWTTRTNLTAPTAQLDLIIAMPDAGNSWYVNSAGDPTARYEDFLVRDFVEEIDSHFRTIPERKTRFIAGLSMGGYAAVFMSVKYPELFSYAGGLSAALDAPLTLDERKPEFRERLSAAFGPHDSDVRHDADVFALLDKMDAKQLPSLFRLRRARHVSRSEPPSGREAPRGERRLPVSRVSRRSFLAVLGCRNHAFSTRTLFRRSCPWQRLNRKKVFQNRKRSADTPLSTPNRVGFRFVLNPFSR